MKRCPGCMTTLPLDAFYPNRTGRPGVSGECKECTKARNNAHYHANRDRIRVKVRASYLLKTWGLTVEQYDEMLVEQDGGCAICGTTEPKGNGSFHVDHDHETGELRGLLCWPCNSRLGHVEDRDWMERAQAYLCQPTRRRKS